MFPIYFARLLLPVRIGPPSRMVAGCGARNVADEAWIDCPVCSRPLSQGLGPVTHQMNTDAIRCKDKQAGTRYEIGCLLIVGESLSMVESSAHLESNDLSFPDTLRTMADALPALMAIMDRDLRYEFVNATYCRYFGLSAEAIRGKSSKDLLGDNLFEQVRARSRCIGRRKSTGHRPAGRKRSHDRHRLHGRCQRYVEPTRKSAGRRSGREVPRSRASSGRYRR